ncbi:MAG: GNAT family N-acetyltransferase [Thiohalomonadales bacterium]|nr:GNAT family N-acetyltransferase [Thiohalomonadales bacterium]
MSRGEFDESLRLVPYAARYRDSVLALFKSVPYKPAIWAWEFESNPTGKPFDPVVIVNGDDQVVGFNGIIPVRATSHGKVLDLAWSCDFYVAAECRGQGVGTWLKKELDKRASVILAFGVSDQADKVLSHLGWHHPNNVYNYRLSREWGSLRSLALRGLQRFNRILGWFNTRLYRGSVSVQERLPAREEVDCLWASVAPDYEGVITRDYAYLDWRYQLHPRARYGFLVARSETGLEGILIVRYTQGSLKLVDYCGPAHHAALKRALIRRCRRHWRHAEQFSLTTSDLEMGQCALREGFFRARSQPRFFMRVVPGSQGTISRDGPHWFIMTGDSDGELLQAAADFSRGY